MGGEGATNFPRDELHTGFKKYMERSLGCVPLTTAAGQIMALHSAANIRAFTVCFLIAGTSIVLSGS